jgi:hypothetical protein
MTTPDTEKELRERIAVAEATLKSHADILKEMRDAVVGINTTLHTLTRLEERVIAFQRQHDNTQTLIKQEVTNREKQAESYGRRLGDIETVLNTVGTDTTMNNHGRELIERWFPAAVSVIIASATSYFIATEVAGV